MRYGKDDGDFQRVHMMMTPMIDVCFQMIIFFVANMRIFLPEGNFNIEMPAASAQAGVASDDAQIPPIIDPHPGRQGWRAPEEPGLRLPRRLYAGHRLGSRQVAPRLVPGEQLPPGFDAIDTLSTRHRRFTFVRLLNSYLTD